MALSDEPPPIVRDLSDRARHEAERRAAITAATVHEAIRLEGEAELARPTSALAWSGFAAGLSMGFSLVAQGVALPLLPDLPWRQLVTKFGYALGFLIVILGRQQLFTENTLTPIIPLLSRRDLSQLPNVLRLWGVVLASNVAGALAFAWIVGSGEVFSPHIRQAFTLVSRDTLSPNPWAILVRAIFAGWLIALMVWLLPFAESGRIAVITMITYLVGLAGFPHIIAGGVEVLYLVVTGAFSPAAATVGWLLPTLFGNIIGGVAFVAALNHAQVIAGTGQRETDSE
jgi:formate/nitrite transporter FocA (FNT family)